MLIDPSHRNRGTLAAQSCWCRADGLYVSLSETRLINLYNLQIYIDKRLESDDDLLQSDFFDFFTEWSGLVRDEIELRLKNNPPI